MFTIKEPNEKVIAFISTNHPQTQGLRLACWTIPFEYNGVKLMKNTLTGEIVSLTDEEFAAPEKVLELAKRRFVVPEDYDETAQYLQVVDLIRITQPESKGLKTYTILPTTACNARCVYCYEEGYPVKTMTKETADKLVDFICETRQEDEITLSWFGGEPTVCADTISRVCSGLESRGVPFKSRLITNASLITKPLAQEMKKVWHLKKVQVSLDGSRHNYMARKQYIDPVKHNYDTVMAAIRYLADEGINIQLRVNFDKENLTDMQSFIDEMEMLFGKYDNVKMYLYMLFQQQHQSDCLDVYKEYYELLSNNYDKKVFNKQSGKSEFRTNYCMADSLDKSIVIDPLGAFYNCEHLPGNENSWGNIFDGVTDQKRFDELCSPSDVDKKCVGCAFLPQCTRFYRAHCPNSFDYCIEQNKMKTDFELKILAEQLLQHELSDKRK